ncbi:hypothetical protein BDY19DRAFT_989927 [Irpex rosettiformis]|uniref:Uncharacterized protein n=1 Tax=Irpex rosettiformis TaxID=378272 RepID=A0ACB8UG72_9APHY|nr:hypothetical protein BDY19DRAFT_989927 [Irpex rosettiformis]
MTDSSMHYVYTTSLQHQHEYPQAYYASQQPLQQSSMPMTAYYQPDQSQRKRPKYTRSKTGCMTCRAKKVKCDEEKPDCARCRSSGRECVWPDGGTSRKRSARRDARPSHSPSNDIRPPTAGSSGPSEHSTSPARHFTPPKAEPVEYSLSDTASRRASTGSDHLNSRNRAPETQDYSVPRHWSSTAPISSDTTQYYSYQHTPPQSASIEQYDQPISYAHSQPLHPQHHQGLPIKTEHDQEWHAAMSQHVDPIHPFAYPAMQDYYTTAQDSVIGGQVPHQHMAYPYIKYT